MNHGVHRTLQIGIVSTDPQLHSGESTIDLR